MENRELVSPDSNQKRAEHFGAKCVGFLRYLTDGLMFEIKAELAQLELDNYENFYEHFNQEKH